MLSCFLFLGELVGGLALSWVVIFSRPGRLTVMACLIVLDMAALGCEYIGAGTLFPRRFLTRSAIIISQ